MASYQDQIEELRVLIKANRFDEARELLETLNHPKAEEWLKKLDEREAAYRAASGVQPWQPSHSTAKNGRSTPVSENRKAPPKTEAPKQTSAAANAAISFVRVLVGSVVAFALVLAVMIFLDRQFAIHNYFLDDSNRRVVTLAVGFALFSTAIFGFIARLIGGAANFFIGLYYALLALLMLAAWQYLSVYDLQGAEAALGHWLSTDATNSYRVFLNTLPLETMLAYGFSVVVSIGVAYFLGATSDEELQKRTERMKANRR